MSRTSRLTRTDQKFLSFAWSSLWKLSPEPAGFICKSKAVVFTAFCSSPVSRARLSTNESAIRNSIASHPEDFHDLVAQVVDHLHSDAATLRLVERTRCVAVQRRPCVGVDFRLQRRLQRVIRIVRTQEV